MASEVGEWDESHLRCWEESLYCKPGGKSGKELAVALV